MDLSIIIPVHNLENYIQPLLLSFSKQKTNSVKVEYIFVFDNCSDGTRTIVENWSNQIKDENISFIFLDADVKNCGLARNIGIENSTGEFVWFVDGDDMILQSDAIQVLVDAMKNKKFKMMRFDWVSNGYPHHPGDWCVVWQYIYRRDFIGETRFQNVEPDEDVLFNRELIGRLDQPLMKLNYEIYYYNYGRPGSNMTNFYSNLNHKIT